MLFLQSLVLVGGFATSRLRPGLQRQRGVGTLQHAIGLYVLPNARLKIEVPYPINGLK